jgi:hypothetical protein
MSVARLIIMDAGGARERVPVGRDNAPAESTIGLVKTELIKPRGTWRTCDHVEIAASGTSTGRTTAV